MTLPRELLEEPLYSRAEKLIAEIFEKQDLAPETKLDVPTRTPDFHPLEHAHAAQTQKKPHFAESLAEPSRERILWKALPGMPDIYKDVSKLFRLILGFPVIEEARNLQAAHIYME